jgi:chromosome segregation ATPase
VTTSEIFLDTLENVDDINSIVDTILKLRQDHMKLTSELNQRNEQMHVENEKLVGNVHRQQSIINEYIQTKTELERRLLNNEQELRNLKKEIEDKNDQYQRLQNEYQLYKEDNQTRKSKKFEMMSVFKIFILL